MPNYVQYFGSNVTEDVAESWEEIEISWVEVDGAGWRWVHGLVIHISKYHSLTDIDAFQNTLLCTKDMSKMSLSLKINQDKSVILLPSFRTSERFPFC